jgi:hypothetical protein
MRTYMKALFQRFRQSLNMAERYGALFMGISGAPPDQGLGKHFVPGHLSGYYKFWSSYDTSGTFASPFYHRLHIAHLEALKLSYPEHAGRFRELRETFQGQLASRPNLLRAEALKGHQKLQDPPNIVKP